MAKPEAKSLVFPVLIVVFIVLAAIIVIAVIIAPQSSTTFIDSNSGRLRIQTVKCWIFFSEYYQETKFSKLVNKYGFSTSPANWKKAGETEKSFSKIRIRDFPYGRINHRCMLFASLIEDSEMSDTVKKRHLGNFMKLLQNGDLKGIENFMKRLSAVLLSKADLPNHITPHVSRIEFERNKQRKTRPLRYMRSFKESDTSQIFRRRPDNSRGRHENIFAKNRRTRYVR